MEHRYDEQIDHELHKATYLADPNKSERFKHLLRTIDLRVTLELWGATQEAKTLAIMAVLELYDEAVKRSNVPQDVLDRLDSAWTNLDKKSGTHHRTNQIFLEEVTNIVTGPTQTHQT